MNNYVKKLDLTFLSQICFHGLMKAWLSIFALIISTTLPASAQEAPQFAFPIECKLGEDCWIANYVDVDPAENESRDFKCGNKTYEGHKGTDFALRSRKEMKGGVNVLAAADGKILRSRDGENDTVKTEEEYKAIKAADKDCGNGIIINHGSGLMTYYCHLKNGSITVKPGDEVEENEIIAQIGQSGYAEFPHLHFTVLWEGGHIDPFTGMLKEDGCGEFKNNLWKDNLAYTPYAIFDGGFASKIPDFKEIETGENTPPAPSVAGKTFVFWSSFYQVSAGDEITLSVKDPNGKIFVERTIIQDKNRARQHYYTGRKLKDRALIPGTYTGKTTIKASGHAPQSLQYTINVQ